MGVLDFFKNLHNSHKRDQAAIDISVAVGALQQCPACQSVYDREHTELIPAAEQEGIKRIENNDKSVACFSGDKDDLIKRIYSIRPPIPYQCDCERDSDSN